MTQAFLSAPMEKNIKMIFFQNNDGAFQSLVYQIYDAGFFWYTNEGKCQKDVLKKS